MKRLMVDICYYLETSNSYQKQKRFFYNILENTNSSYKKFLDAFMIALILISVVILIREVKSHVDDNLLFFNNYVISFIFLIEYILRLWVTSSVSKIIIEQYEHDVTIGEPFKLWRALKKVLKVKILYIISPKALIDLFAILPFFHQLRLLRMFILFRVFKLFRYAKSIQMFTSILSAKKFEFFTLSIFASIIVFVASVIIYVMEANNPESPINTFFDAIYWSVVTISTVGFGDIVPVTPEGRVVAMLVIIAGIGVFSFSTSLIVTSFTEKLDEIKNIKLIDDIAKLKEFYLICGYESISKEVAKKLSQHNEVIILEENLQKVELAKKDGFTVLNYDPGSVESYKKMRINLETQVKAILCLSHSDVENVYTALTIRSFNKDIFIMSILINKVNKGKLSFAGVNEILYEKELVGVIAKEFVGQPVAFEAIHELRSNHKGMNLEEFLIDDRVLEFYKTIGELENKRYRIILLGIYKSYQEQFVFNPSDSTPLERGDYIVLIGNTLFLKEFYQLIHKKRFSK